MAANLKCNCGCQFVTEDLLVAQVHARETGHVLTVQGQVRPDVERELVFSRSRVVPKVVEDEG